MVDRVVCVLPLSGRGRVWTAETQHAHWTDDGTHGTERGKASKGRLERGAGDCGAALVGVGAPRDLGDRALATAPGTASERHAPGTAQPPSSVVAPSASRRTQGSGISAKIELICEKSNFFGKNRYFKYFFF